MDDEDGKIEMQAALGVVPQKHAREESSSEAGPRKLVRNEGHSESKITPTVEIDSTSLTHLEGTGSEDSDRDSDTDSYSSQYSLYTNYKRLTRSEPDDDDSSASDTSDYPEDSDKPLQKLLIKYKKLEDFYVTSEYASKVRAVFSRQNWTIDRIVILGLDTNMVQLAHIKDIASTISKQAEGRDIEIYAQDPSYRQFPGTVFAKVLEYHGITVLEMDLDPCKRSNEDAGPAKELLTPTTLIFAPFPCWQFFFKLLDGADIEAWLGTNLGVMERDIKDDRPYSDYVLSLKQQARAELSDRLTSLTDSLAWMEMPKEVDGDKKWLRGKLWQMIL